MSKERLRSVPRTLREIKEGKHQGLLKRAENVLGIPKEKIIESMERTAAHLRKRKEGKKDRNE